MIVFDASKGLASGDGVDQLVDGALKWYAAAAVGLALGADDLAACAFLVEVDGYGQELLVISD